MTSISGPLRASDRRAEPALCRAARLGPGSVAHRSSELLRHMTGELLAPTVPVGQPCGVRVGVGIAQRQPIALLSPLLYRSFEFVRQCTPAFVNDRPILVDAPERERAAIAPLKDEVFGHGRQSC